MIILLQIISLCINTLILSNVLSKIKNNLRITHAVLLIFQVIFVFPIVLEWLFGIQDYRYKSLGFHQALNDNTTNIIYSLFIILVPLLFFFSIKKNNSKGIIVEDIRSIILNLRISRGLYVISFTLMFLPFLLALISPSPDKYLAHYAYFQRFRRLATEAELWYHSNIMSIGGFIALIFILITKLFSKNSKLDNFVIYCAAIITGVLNGKRTVLAFIIFGILAVDILKSPKGKFPIKKTIISGIFIVLFFIGYAFLMDKHAANVTIIDNLRLYFFRDIDVKFSIYALLNPEEYRILDYWGQSYLFNILFYIPRSFWPNKPYPYDIYVTAAALGYPPGTILSWNFQTSIFGEALSNLGWYGIPFILILINKFIKVSERSRNPIINILCLFIIMFSFMNHFGTWRNYFIIWLFLCVSNKVKLKSTSKKRITKKLKNNGVKIL